MNKLLLILLILLCLLTPYIKQVTNYESSNLLYNNKTTSHLLKYLTYQSLNHSNKLKYVPKVDIYPLMYIIYHPYYKNTVLLNTHQKIQMEYCKNEYFTNLNEQFFVFVPKRNDVKKLQTQFASNIAKGLKVPASESMKLLYWSQHYEIIDEYHPKFVDLLQRMNSYEPTLTMGNDFDQLNSLTHQAFDSKIYYDMFISRLKIQWYSTNEIKKYYDRLKECLNNQSTMDLDQCALEFAEYYTMYDNYVIVNKKDYVDINSNTCKDVFIDYMCSMAENKVKVFKKALRNSILNKSDYCMRRIVYESIPEIKDLLFKNKFNLGFELFLKYNEEKYEHMKNHIDNYGKNPDFNLHFCDYPYMQLYYAVKMQQNLTCKFKRYENQYKKCYAEKQGFNCEVLNYQTCNTMYNIDNMTLNEIKRYSGYEKEFFKTRFKQDSEYKNYEKTRIDNERFVQKLQYDQERFKQVDVTKLEYDKMLRDERNEYVPKKKETSGLLFIDALKNFFFTNSMLKKKMNSTWLLIIILEFIILYRNILFTLKTVYFYMLNYYNLIKELEFKRLKENFLYSMQKTNTELWLDRINVPDWKKALIFYMQASKAMEYYFEVVIWMYVDNNNTREYSKLRHPRRDRYRKQCDNQYTMKDISPAPRFFFHDYITEREQYFYNSNYLKTFFSDPGERFDQDKLYTPRKGFGGFLESVWLVVFDYDFEQITHFLIWIVTVFLIYAQWVNNLCLSMFRIIFEDQTPDLLANNQILITRTIEELKSSKKFLTYYNLATDILENYKPYATTSAEVYAYAERVNFWLMVIAVTSIPIISNPYYKDLLSRFIGGFVTSVLVNKIMYMLAKPDNYFNFMENGIYKDLALIIYKFLDYREFLTPTERNQINEINRKAKESEQKMKEKDDNENAVKFQQVNMNSDDLINTVQEKFSYVESLLTEKHIDHDFTQLDTLYRNDVNEE